MKTAKKKGATSAPETAKAGAKGKRSTKGEVPSEVAAEIAPGLAMPPHEPSTITMLELGARFAGHLEASGKSGVTREVYAKDLQLAIAFLGESTPIAELDAARIEAFEQSQSVTTTSMGRPKAKPTVDRTRRVLRLALVHAASQGWIAAAPYAAKSAS